MNYYDSSPPSDPLGGTGTDSYRGGTRCVTQIVFGDDVGTLRWSESSQQYFPPSYVYDPYTDQPLVFRTPEARLRPPTKGLSTIGQYRDKTPDAQAKVQQIGSSAPPSRAMAPTWRGGSR